MNKKENTPRRVKMVINVFAIILGISIILGVSYAIFRASDTGRKTNTIKTGDFGLEIKNESDDSINLTHSIPMKEEDGLKTNPYTFDVVNTGDYDINYKLGFEISSDTTMSASSVRYVLVKDGVKGSSALVSSAVLENITTDDGTKKVYYVANYDIATGTTQKFKLYMWLDYNATESIANTVFKANVRVDGEATTITPRKTLREPTDEEKASFYRELNVFIAQRGGQNGVTYAALGGNNGYAIFIVYNNNIYVYPFNDFTGDGELYEGNKWYFSRDNDTLVEYTDDCPFEKSFFTNIYSNSYLDAIVESFGN